MNVSRKTWMAALAALLFAGHASAAIPYSPVPFIGPPSLGPGVAPPDFVYGKEYSHDADFSTIGPALDPQQVIAWDGGGGAADSVDFTGSRMSWDPDQDIDAIANSRDALFDELRFDLAHLTFTHDDTIAGYTPSGLTAMTVPPVGPVVLSSGAVIGGAGEVSLEEAVGFGAAPATKYLWASAPEVNGMPLPDDVDGTELWGPEPRPIDEPDAPVIGDVDKYSLDTDAPSGVSVWNGAGSPYIDHATIVGAVTTLLGSVPSSAFSLFDEAQGREAINLDALMVQDVIGSRDNFDQDFFVTGADEPLLDQNGVELAPFDPNSEESGDQIIFSIRQIVDPADPDGYYATGSELFVLDSLTGVSYLEHGGHVWDQGHALSELGLKDEDATHENFAVIDINGIEAIGEGQLDPDPCFPGDADGDGDVDGDDLIAVQTNFGATSPPSPLLGDADCDGDVDGDDLIAVQTNFGNTMSPSTSIPEPAAAGLLVACLASVVAMRARLG